LIDVEKVKLNIELFDNVLPEGVLRNSFIVLSGKGGAGKSLLLICIAKIFLDNGEPVFYLALDDDPITIIKQFHLLDVNISEYVKKGLFYIIDGYSFRIRGKKEKMHLSVIEEVDPQNMNQVLNACIKVLDEQNIANRGMFIIDSLNEFLSFYDINKAIEFIKNFRANISKARNIIVMSILHTSSKIAEDFLSLIEHIIDGIILTETVVQTHPSNIVYTPLRQLLVKKMKGVPHSTNWTLYTIEKGNIKIKPVAIKT